VIQKLPSGFSVTSGHLAAQQANEGEMWRWHRSTVDRRRVLFVAAVRSRALFVAGARRAKHFAFCDNRNQCFICAKTEIAENSTRKHHTMFTRIVQAAAVGGGWAECVVQGRREMTITNADQAYDDLIEISAAVSR
jgi:hypothetical protein